MPSLEYATVKTSNVRFFCAGFNVRKLLRESGNPPQCANQKAALRVSLTVRKITYFTSLSFLFCVIQFSEKHWPP